MQNPFLKLGGHVIHVSKKSAYHVKINFGQELFGRSEGVTFKLVPPQQHQCNTVKWAIRKLKTIS